MDELPTQEQLRDIDRRQNDLLAELERLNRRIEDVLKQQHRPTQTPPRVVDPSRG